MEYLNKMKEIQNHILEFLDSETEDQPNFDNLSQIIKSQTSHLEVQEIKSFLNIISKIVENHHRSPFFFEKINQIILLMKDEIKQTFSNIEIYNFFKNNKRMLLLLISEDILIFDKIISRETSKNKEYFYIENNKLKQKEEAIKIPENYEEKRLKGENDSYLCELIRNDDVENFIVYINKNNISLSMTIENSIYETNSIFEYNQPKLIEYSAFFGSIQILRFLYQNHVDSPQSLWIYAIHGKNPEIIHFLESNQIRPKDESYQECLKESIKCHHNDFAIYFKDNFINEVDVQSNYFNNEMYYAFNFANFQFIPIECTEKFCFFYAIEFGYYKLVEYYKNIQDLNINDKIICALKLAADTNNYDILDYLLQLPEIELVSNCFKNCKSLTNISIPSSIKYIGEYSFSGCENLTTIFIPSSVNKIEDHSFEGCKNLKTISIPSSVDSIGKCSFSGCENLTTISLQSPLKYIGDYTFQCCKHLISIEIPSTVIWIGIYAFHECENLTTIDLPSNLSSILSHAFDGCIRLKEITMPSSLINIDHYAFQNCSDLKEMILPSSVSTIGDYFVSRCYSLTKIIIPSSVKEIGKLDFRSFTSLKELILPPKVHKIDERAFENCTSLETFEIPSSVISLEKLAFCNCSSLKEITIPPKVMKINQFTFYNCISLIKVNIPSSVEFIDYNAFYGCKSLVEITIPPSVVSIGYNAFQYCTKLTKIEIPKSKNNLPKIVRKDESNNNLYKVLLVGSSNVGKTCIMYRYDKNQYKETFLATIGVDFITKNVNVDGNIVKLQIWDSAGNERFHNITASYYRNTKCIVAVFDLTNPETIERAEKYLEEIHELLPENASLSVSILVGNKCDAESKVSEEKIHELEEKYNAKYFNVSAKDDIGIEDLFKYLAETAFYIDSNEQKRLQDLINMNLGGDDEKKKCNIY